MFALIWLKRQHGSGSRGARGTLQEASQMELLIRSFSFYLPSRIGLGCLNLFSLSLFLVVSALICLPIIYLFIALHIGFLTIKMCRALTSHFVLFSPLSIFFIFFILLLFKLLGMFNLSAIPTGILKCVVYRQIVLFKCFLHQLLL